MGLVTGNWRGRANYQPGLGCLTDAGFSQSPNRRAKAFPLVSVSSDKGDSDEKDHTWREVDGADRVLLVAVDQPDLSGCARQTPRFLPTPSGQVLQPNLLATLLSSFDGDDADGPAVRALAAIV